MGGFGCGVNLAVRAVGSCGWFLCWGGHEPGVVWGKGSEWKEHDCWSQLVTVLVAHSRGSESALGQWHAWDPCSALSATLAAMCCGFAAVVGPQPGLQTRTVDNSCMKRGT